MKSTIIGAFALALAGALATLFLSSSSPPQTASGTRTPLPAPPNPTLFVSSTAPPGGTGVASRPLQTIQAALNVAQPGAVISVAPGTYAGSITTVRAGTAQAPILLLGNRAVIMGRSYDEDRLVQILHSYITVRGFTITMADKLVWIQQATGVRLLGNNINGAGGECVRLKYFTTHAEIAFNTIADCGRTHFNLSKGHKNGEGVYIGTAPEQLDKNPTNRPDVTADNVIHDNRISPRAECVDIKEAARGNIIERNTCRGSLDPDGSAYDSRGSDNVFRYNTADRIAGAGVRLGGDTSSDGVRNSVIGNVLTNIKGYGVKIMRTPQGKICGNRISAARGASNNDAIDPRASC